MSDDGPGLVLYPQPQIRGWIGIDIGESTSEVGEFEVIGEEEVVVEFGGRGLGCGGVEACWWHGGRGVEEGEGVLEKGGWCSEICGHGRDWEE